MDLEWWGSDEVEGSRYIRRSNSVSEKQATERPNVYSCHMQITYTVDQLSDFTDR